MADQDAGAVEQSEELGLNDPPADQAPIPTPDEPTDETPDTQPVSEGSEAAPDPDAELSEEDNAADLQQYPEQLHDLLRGHSRAERKAIFEAAEQRVEPRLQEKYQADRERAAQLEAADAARQAQQRAALEKVGRYTGDVPKAEGEPTYDDLDQLTRRRDYQGLANRGLDMDSALATLADWDERRGLITNMSTHFAELAYAKTGALMRGQIEQLGYDWDTVINGAAGPEDIVARIVTNERTVASEKAAAIEKSYELKLKALSENGQALAGRAAGRTPAPESGGRSGNGSIRTWTNDEIANMTLEQYRANEAEINAANRAGRVTA